MKKLLDYTDIISRAIQLKNDGVNTENKIEIPFIAKVTCNLNIQDKKKILSYPIIKGNPGVISITLCSILKENLKNISSYVSFYEEVKDEKSENNENKKEKKLKESDAENNKIDNEGEKDKGSYIYKKLIKTRKNTKDKQKN